VGELGHGAANLGNLYRAMSEEEASAVLDAAWECGIRYFDTAPHYGLGLSERRLGAALTDRPRGEFVLSSKVGRLLEPLPVVDGLDDDGYAVPRTHRRVFDFSRDGIRRSFAGSLARLGVDRLDIAYMHDPDDHIPDVLATGLPALAELRAEGAVTAIGAGMNDSAPLTRLVRDADIDVVMLAGRYTLLDQKSLDDLLPTCEERGVAVVAAGVFNSGILARSEPPEHAKYDYADAPAELLERARAIARVCERHGTTLPTAAIAFPLAHPAVVDLCVGARSPEQIRLNAARYADDVPTELWAELKADGLLREDAPTP
jgi:D-threo-aldose 1-dehydrogenase